MKNIIVYDIEADDIEQICNDNDLTAAEVVEMLMAYVDELKRDNNLI